MSDVIRGEFVKEALKERINIVSKRGWKFSYKCIEEYFLYFCEEVGLDSENTPSFYVDNAIINGSYGNYNKFFETKEDAFKAYETGDLLFCDYDNETGDLVVIYHF